MQTVTKVTGLTPLSFARDYVSIKVSRETQKSSGFLHERESLSSERETQGYTTSFLLSPPLVVTRETSIMLMYVFVCVVVCVAP